MSVKNGIKIRKEREKKIRLNSLVSKHKERERERERGKT